jgi:thiopeptide-type bacteriocin biosynthesis protein
MTRPIKQFQGLTDAGFFVIRTPSLPAEDLIRWGSGLTALRLAGHPTDADLFRLQWESDISVLRDRLKVIVDRPEVAHALFVASPSLWSAISHWKQYPDSKKGKQAERALVRYFERMCARSTPFGLFSGCSLGRVATDDAEVSSIVLESRQNYKSHTRLDFDSLFTLTSTLRNDPLLAKELMYWPNNSLYRSGSVWHYVESKLVDKNHRHSLVRLDSDSHLESVLDRAKTGATIEDLAQVLILSADSEIASQEAETFIRELIENNVLVSQLSPVVTGISPLTDIIDQLESLPSGKAFAEILRETQTEVAMLDRKGLGIDPNEYSKIVSDLHRLPVKLDSSRLFQVDMIKPVRHGTLAKSIVDELIQGVDTLSRLTPNPELESLKRFRVAFVSRYESAMVPLLEALDEEIGIGFGEPRKDFAPLLQGLRLGGPKDERTPGAATIPEVDSLRGLKTPLLQQLVDCLRKGATELELDVSGLSSDNKSPQYLPDSLVVCAELVANSTAALQQGNFQILLNHALGPSGARMFGRFCYANSELEQHVRNYLREEESCNPEAVFAEIVHLPEGRVGNIICRPALRDYELVYLGRSGMDRNRQILASDLFVGVKDDQIYLYSPKLQRRVIPRLSSAHGFTNSHLAPAYRFLCFLQYQDGTNMCRFSWGSLEALPFLPRVTLGRLILSTARWMVERTDIENITNLKASLSFRAVQELRLRLSLPRWIVLEEHDNTLPVDLDNALSVDAFVHIVKRAQRAVIREMYPSPDQLCVTSDEGSFYHELNVPLIRTSERGDMGRSILADKQRFKVPSKHAEVKSDERCLPPGGQCLYFKLYGGAVTLDEALRTSVDALISRISSGVGLARWFFIRYQDPEQHLRLRFIGEPAWILEELLPLITSLFRPLVDSGRLWKIQFDTYVREIERYGGLQGTLAAEELFCADSYAALALLQDCDDEGEENKRWQITLLGIDLLLANFHLDVSKKYEVAQSLRDAYFHKYGVGAATKKSLGERFRKEREQLEAIMGGHGLESARAVLQQRSTRIEAVADRLYAMETAGSINVPVSELTRSYVHMHVNRMIRSAANHHELILYDFLCRLYDSALARKLP